MKAVYKCRLCGAIYSNDTYTAPKKLAAYCMVELNAGLVSTELMAPTMTETHDCGGDHAGSLGLADFLGWQEEGTE